MLEAAEKAAALAKGRSRANLDQDEIFQLAAIRLIEIIGEAANNVSEQTRKTNVQVPWIPIIGARNHLIHGYFDIDKDRLWEILQNDLPILIKNLKEILKKLPDEI